MSLTIRPYRPEDAVVLDDICLRTGHDGADATSRFADPRLLDAVYVGPYLRFEPQLAFVLDDGGTAQGYVLGCRDTSAFERWCEREWWPPLRERYPPGCAEPGSADSGVVALLHEPPAADPAVLADYPSHLHIDLLPSCQGAGHGRRLIDTLLSALAAAGSPGVHLGVSATNAAAIGFYARLGFLGVGGAGVDGAGVGEAGVDGAGLGALTLGRRLAASPE